MSPYFNAQVLALSNNASPAITAYSVAILQAGSFVGRILAGRLADRFGVWLVFGTIPFFTSLTLFAFWVGSPLGSAPTILGLLFYGAFSGGWFTLAAAATAAISPIEEIGSRIGMMWNGIAVPMLIGPVVTGSECGGKHTRIRKRGADSLQNSSRRGTTRSCTRESGLALPCSSRVCSRLRP